MIVPECLVNIYNTEKLDEREEVVYGLSDSILSTKLTCNQLRHDDV